MKLLSVSHLDFSYKKNENGNYTSPLVLDGVTFDVFSEELVALVGPNGAGKTTLFRILTEEVAVQRRGQPVVQRYGSYAYLPQHNTIDFSFPFTVLDVFNSTFCDGKWTFFKKKTKEWNERVSHMLHHVALFHKRFSLLGELSGGQRQRLLLARLLLLDRDFYLLDEPFSAIDEKTTIDLIKLLQTFSKSPFNKTFLVVMHHIPMASAHFGRILALSHKLLYDGLAENFIQLPY